MQHVNVDASFTSSPKGFIVGKVGKGYGLIAQLCVHCHYCSTTCETEYFGVRPTGAGKCKCHVFNAFGNTQMTVIGMNNQSGGGNILFVTPCLYIAESRQLTMTQGYDCLCLFHFGSKIFVCTLGYSCASYFGCLSDCFKNGVNILLMRRISYHYFYFFHFVFYNLCMLI